MLRSDLKIVILDCPIDAWQTPLVRDLFSKIVQLKLLGYGSRYPYGVIALDATDFVGTHTMICTEGQGQLEPLVAFKSISLARCTTFHLSFPALQIALAARSQPHVEFVSRIMERHQNDPDRLRYFSSWTIQPSLHKNKEQNKQIVDIFSATHVTFAEACRATGSLLCGAIQFKTDRLFNWWGYQPASENGQALPNFKQASLAGAEAKMLYLENLAFTPESKAVAEVYRTLWDSRLTVGGAATSQEKKAA